jgi:hypothetical protein
VVAGRRSGRLALHCMAQWLLEGGGPVHSHSDTARPPKVVAQHVGEVLWVDGYSGCFMSFVAVCPLTERIAHEHIDRGCLPATRDRQGYLYSRFKS